MTLPTELLRQVHPTFNDPDFDYNTLTPGSNRKLWWKCPVADDHEWLTTVGSRALLGRNCPYCSGNKPSSTNNLTVYDGFNASKILAEWNYERNIKKPSEYVIGSTQKVWWKCQVNPKHVWEMQIRKRTERNQGCVYCAGRYPSEENNLSITHPVYAKQFDEKRNEIKATQITIGNRQKYYWVCTNGHEMFMSPHNRSRAGSVCQQCNNSGVSTFETQLREDLNLMVPNLYLGVRKLPIKWRRNSTLTVDISGKFNNTNFAIEYDSKYWHQTKADTFDRDYAKSIALLESGYSLIRVREVGLPSLSISHSAYKEISYDYKKENAKTEKLVKDIIRSLKVITA